MMRAITQIMLIVGVVVVSGCARSPSSKFYLLSALPQSVATVSGEQISGPVVLIRPLNFPDYIDRPQIVVRENNFELHFSETHRWAEPLQDSFLRVLAENLEARIAPGRVVLYGEMMPGQPNYQLFVDILRLDADRTGRQVILKVNWTLSEGTGKKLFRSLTSEFSVPLANDNYETIAAAHSQAVAAFAQRVADAVREEQKMSLR